MGEKKRKSRHGLVTVQSCDTTNQLINQQRYGILKTMDNNKRLNQSKGYIYIKGEKESTFSFSSCYSIFPNPNHYHATTALTRNKHTTPTTSTLTMMATTTTNTQHTNTTERSEMIERTIN